MQQVGGEKRSLVEAMVTDTPESISKRSNNNKTIPLDFPQDPEAVKDVESSLRFLVPNHIAGCIIGKGGSTITEIQQSAGVRMQLSRQNETFPGTGDRVISVSGTVSAILTALHLILTKISEDFPGRKGNPESYATLPAPELKIVIPHKTCGAIIGKGGATVQLVPFICS
eukprot:TRINITY_DN15630_c0_g2_i2.p1 TRINITY_DN15630_c0_g2~~TRINITY_DN15630_c0_g2_i2.p1  ORF type:complete len:170 (-),score=13.65 TRINITY_DN15630_c0_g2_i2:115-624(-)